MATQRLGLIMNGITGRMGYNQHLVRSICAIRDEGGVLLPDGDRVMPDPFLVGRELEKLQDIAGKHGIKRCGTDVDAALANEDDTVFFDAGPTAMRAKLLTRAIKAGKNTYCEKPTATSLEDAVALARLAEKHGVKTGVVQDKLYLPGLSKLRNLVENGFSGRILSVQGEFGYWVFEGDWQPSQRPSWNYRKADGGGIILYMLPHWRYVFDNILAPIKSLNCLGVTLIPSRVDEEGRTYTADADDAAFATFELENGIIVQMNSSWATRVKRDDLVTFQVDGTHGSAVVGLTRCHTQHRVNTPCPRWNPDIPQTIPFETQWEEVPDNRAYENAFKFQWEDFVAECLVMMCGGLPDGSKSLDDARTVVRDEPSAILDDARAAGVRLALEPLHPMTCADRSVLSTLSQALDLCDELGAGMAVAVDVYHVWWDPTIRQQISRAGDRIAAFHVCDWLVPTTDTVFDRGMPGDGVMDVPGMRHMAEAAGYDGLLEIEILSRHWWAQDPDLVLRTCVERHEQFC